MDHDLRAQRDGLYYTQVARWSARGVALIFLAVGVCVPLAHQHLERALLVTAILLAVCEVRIRFMGMRVSGNGVCLVGAFRTRCIDLFDIASYSIRSRGTESTRSIFLRTTDGETYRCPGIAFLRERDHLWQLPPSGPAHQFPEPPTDTLTRLFGRLDTAGDGGLANLGHNRGYAR
jgi:hypothetical protein